jgi:hypothetical protein
MEAPRDIVPAESLLQVDDYMHRTDDYIQMFNDDMRNNNQTRHKYRMEERSSGEVPRREMYSWKEQV